uniref:ninjurin-1 isoform X2 n=1 Tax=Oncorhynchus gorbuscha TaxID=8017 RepID=UPI001EAF7CAF|nr:ninjurin-1 isoform X2 [Oncorhynchus gorbuscha]
MDSEARANGEDITLNKLDDIEANHDRLDPSGKVYRMINMNHYATRKSVAQSMLDVALLMANSSQLKTVLNMESQYRFYKPLIVLLSMSITLQVVVGLLLVFIVIINIFITALGFEGAVIGLPEPQSFLLTTEQNQTGGL